MNQQPWVEQLLYHQTCQYHGLTLQNNISQSEYKGKKFVTIFKVSISLWTQRTRFLPSQSVCVCVCVCVAKVIYKWLFVEATWRGEERSRFFQIPSVTPRFKTPFVSYLKCLLDTRDEITLPSLSPAPTFPKTSKLSCFKMEVSPQYITSPIWPIQTQFYNHFLLNLKELCHNI